MSVMVVVHTPIDPAKVEEALEIFRAEILPSTRTEEGCESVTLHIDQDDGKLIVLQRWTSREAYQAYFEWRMGRTEEAARMGALGTGERPTVRFYDDVDA
jgi:quinol monooxygenase YgiN